MLYQTGIHCIVYENCEPPAGLEPAIPGLGGRCLIHWATEAIANIRVVLVKSLVRLRF